MNPIAETLLILQRNTDTIAPRQRNAGPSNEEPEETPQDLPQDLALANAEIERLRALLENQT